MSKIFQFKISLKGSEPKIWRRFQTEDDLMFFDLHYIIQAVMGWENDHLYQFIVEKNRCIGDPEMLESDDIMDDGKTKLSDIFNEPKTKIIYEYDFGDGWEHELVLEKILEKDPKQHYPVCLEGKLNCPPEDCGGIYGFNNMMQIFKDEKHPEHEDIKEWVGENYDPDYFDPEDVNKSMRS